MNPAINPDLLSRMEDAGLNASAPTQQRWIDGWLLRFSPGKAKRARCVNAVAQGRLPLEERLQRCGQVLAQAGLPKIVRITPFTQPAELDAWLAARGWQRLDETRVMVLPDLYRLPALPLPAKVSVHAVGLAPFAHRIGLLRGSPLAHRQAHAERLVHAPVSFSAFELRADNGEVLACGQFALENDLVGLYDVFTVASARGKGYARMLCQQMLLQARQRGAQHAYLQAESDNHAALAVYRRLGFADGYTYHYRAEADAV